MHNHSHTSIFTFFNISGVWLLCLKKTTKNKNKKQKQKTNNNKKNSYNQN